MNLDPMEIRILVRAVMKHTGTPFTIRIWNKILRFMRWKRSNASITSDTRERS